MRTTKPEAPSSKEAPISKSRNGAQTYWRLKVEISLELGYWGLVVPTLPSNA
jgi:hypothetical protein